MVKVVANHNPREAVEELNSRKIKKEEIISIIKDGETFLIFYWKE